MPRLAGILGTPYHQLETACEVRLSHNVESGTLIFWITHITSSLRIVSISILVIAFLAYWLEFLLHGWKLASTNYVTCVVAPLMEASSFRAWPAQGCWISGAAFCICSPTALSGLQLCSQLSCRGVFHNCCDYRRLTTPIHVCQIWKRHERPDVILHIRTLARITFCWRNMQCHSTKSAPLQQPWAMYRMAVQHLTTPA